MDGNRLVNDSESVPVGGTSSNDIDRTSRESTTSEYYISTIYDNSHHDRSKHHYGNVHVTTNYNGDLTGVGMKQMRLQARDRLLLASVSHGALHNSAQRGPDAPKCYPETRIAVQEEIPSWIKHGHHTTNPKQILWLSGPAGSGKTAIAGSIADECDKEGLLAASFFFSSFGGSLDRSSKRPFIATLVYQLMQHDSMHGLRDEVFATLERDPLILKRNLDAQADVLLLGPLRKTYLRSDTHNWPHLVLIDGLDECAGAEGEDGAVQDTRKQRERTHREILSVLLRMSSEPSFPFRIIIASRPEQAIERFFSSLPKGSVKKVFLDNKYDPTSDIQLFIRAMLNKIGWEYGLPEGWYNQALPLNWPEYKTRDIPAYLAREASEQFIYASTVIRYMQDGVSTPIEQLRSILSSRRTCASNPFSALDTLYSMILKTSPTPLLSATWLLAISDLSRSAGIVALWYIKALFESSPGETKVRLGNLTSVVGLPSGGDSDERPFTFYHKSLLDFLEEPERSGKLYVDRGSTLHPFLVDRHYQILKNRGPQVPLREDLFNRFLRTFSVRYTAYHAVHFQFDPSDVAWRTALLLPEHNPIGRALELIWMFEVAHRSCRWYRCLPSCKVWRSGMIKLCKVKGWRIPTSLELLEDRFRKFNYYGSGVERSWLRPPITGP